MKTVRENFLYISTLYNEIKEKDKANKFFNVSIMIKMNPQNPDDMKLNFFMDTFNPEDQNLNFKKRPKFEISETIYNK